MLPPPQVRFFHKSILRPLLLGILVAFLVLGSVDPFERLVLSVPSRALLEIEQRTPLGRGVVSLVGAHSLEVPRGCSWSYPPVDDGVGEPVFVVAPAVLGLAAQLLLVVGIPT